MTEMVSSATEFVRSGFSEEDSAQLAQVAELYRNVADAEISSAESAQFITSQIKAFNLDANDAITILDQLNAVSNNYAVSSTDIATALSKTSSAMATLGNTSQETIGLVTAGTEQLTGQASKVAKGLRTIGLNIAKTATDSGELNYQIGNTTKNISLLDKSTGDMKSTFQVLSEIAEDWDKMSNAEKTAIGQTLAGKNQYEVFSAVLNQFDDAISATQTALNSQGSAMAENSKYMGSMQAKLNAMKSAFQELALGDGSLSSFLKKMIDIGTAIINFVNKGKVLQVLLVDLSIILAVKFIPQLVLMAFTMKTKLLKVIPNLIAGVTLLFEAIHKGGGVITATNFMIEASIPVIGLVLAAISALVIGYNVLKSSQKETKKTTEELNSEYEESKSKLDSLQKSLDDVNSKIEAIKSQGTLEITDKDDLTNLRIQKEELETQLSLQKAINEEKQKSLEKDAKKNVYKKIKTPYIGKEHTYTGEDVNYGYAKVNSDYKNVRLTDTGTTSSGESYITTTEMESADKVQQLKAISEEMLKQQNIIDSLSSKKEKNKKLTKDEQIQLDKTINSYKDAREVGTKYADELNQQTINLDENSETRKYALSGIDSFTQGISDISSATSKATGYSEDYGEELDEGTTNTDALTLALETLSSQLTDITSIDLSGIEEAFNTINQAQTELNSASGLTLGTYESLISLGSEYLSVLFDEQGNLRNTADAERELYYAKIDEMAITQAQALIKKAVETENQNGADSYANYANSIYKTTDALWGSVYATLASQQATGSLSKSSYQAVLSQVNSLRDYANQAKQNITTTNGYTKATNDNTSATKANTDALNEQKEALQQQKEDYDNVISYIKDKIEDYIDTLENARDSEVDVIEAQIDKLEELKDSQSDAIDENINNLEKEQEIKISNIDSQLDKLKELQSAEEDYWQSKIDKLKEQNDELESQIELETLLENLAKAKSRRVKVYRENKGFVYETDTQEVNTAQKNLQDYYTKKAYQDKLDTLENFKETAKNNYDKQIEDLEKHQEDLKNSYDRQIEDLETYRDNLVSNYEKQIEVLKAQEQTVKDSYEVQIQYYKDWSSQFTESVNSYETEQNRLKALELTGIDFEQKGWQTRLGNLNGFVNGYSSLLAQLSSVQKQVNNASKAISNDVSVASNALTEANKKMEEDALKQDKYIVKTRAGAQVSNYLSEGEALLQASKIEGGYISYVGRYANGTYGTDKNEIAMVGDKPNSELVVGSKLNGTPMNLSKGTGVIPHNLTNILTNMASQYQSGVSPINKSSSNSTSINIANLSVKANNANEFIQSLKGFKTKMIQESFA